MSKEEYPLPIIIVDTREREGYKFRPSENCAGFEVAKVDAGDYSLKGYEELICIERKKNILELCGNLGKQRKRFEAELERMQKVKFRFIVIEDTWDSIFKSKKFTSMSYASIFQSIIALTIKYNVQFIFAGDRKMAQAITRGLLVKAYSYHMKGIV